MLGAVLRGMEASMALDKLALILIVAGGVLWAGVMLVGAVATLPFGLPILVGLLVGGYFCYRVVKDRVTSAEDDYYEKNVKQ
jgi:hypothetical protein